MGFLIFLLVLIGIGMLATMVKKAGRKQKQARLLAKYGDPELVQRLMNGNVWQGQTAEQLTDAIGSPADIDQKVLKTKTTETWKYGKEGARSYRLRIKIENGVVVGWEQR